MAVDQATIKDYLKEIMENVSLILWIIASNWSQMNPTSQLIGALVIFLAVIAFKIYMKRSENAIALAKMQVDAKTEEHRIWCESNQDMLTESAKVGMDRTAEAGFFWA